MRERLKSGWPEMVAVGFVPTFIFVFGILLPGINIGWFVSPLNWLYAFLILGTMVVFNGIVLELSQRLLGLDTYQGVAND